LAPLLSATSSLDSFWIIAWDPLHDSGPGQ
jgi:hypothetical protein